jgi:hypothetical protein
MACTMYAPILPCAPYSIELVARRLGAKVQTDRLPDRKRLRQKRRSPQRV